MKIGNFLQIFNYCQSFDFLEFGVGYRPDYYRRFEWIDDPRLLKYVRAHNRDIGLIRLSGDVPLHRDKSVRQDVKLIAFRDFWLELDGKLIRLEAGDLFEFDGGLPHRAWDVCCLVMWSKMRSVSDYSQLSFL